MNIDKIIEKTQQYNKLRSELITEIEQIVSHAKALIETLYSVAATEDNIKDISEYEMDEELYGLANINVHNDRDLNIYFDILLDVMYKLNSLEKFLDDKIR